MKDSKLVCLLAAQLGCIKWDDYYKRSIGYQVILSLGSLPDDVFPEDIDEQMKFINDCFRYEYGMSEERPSWYKE